MAEDEIVGWHHQFNGHELDQTLGDRGGHGSLVFCSSKSPTQLSDCTMTKYFIVHMYHNFFSHSSFEEYLDFLHILAIVDSEHLFSHSHFRSFLNVWNLADNI